MIDDTRQILSIQSHVVHGYVGNKAATFPLQYRGWNVDSLNTVQFSNHPGYGSFTGFRDDKENLYKIIDSGLINGLNIKYNAIITGYLPSVDSLQSISRLVNDLCIKEQIPWILDPVLGDNGKLYVDMECVTIYKDILSTCQVYLTVPNQFEMETLTGMKIKDMDTLKRSFQNFHRSYPGVKRVIVSSIDFSMDHSQSTDCDTYTVAFAESPNFDQFQYFTVEKIQAHFNGSGDLFSALLVDMLFPVVEQSVTSTLASAVGKALNLTHQILNKTYRLTVKSVETHPPSETETVPHIKDLKLIQCAELLRIRTEDIDIRYPLSQVK
ncbi:similar to Saccharomyces cerevisiae YNR027W BUD17 Putative pyridoxal kinase, a key enzyme in vitamin B6 metabolism [Maudiozyma barnettii]|uniref:pyridoxal kinase n=1 Tax=Maudiozyma barnettii TaxID=61262 RepID=A0A8H2ZKQ7_9SACH|nr:putative pyridoxal kinase BUD17 [Kazachstania barnettii]CAB4255412.1 similar to Saccharomyces cerevisiae YNR027W BUD17 Putative pyridoxal kinase, a key enzyme in vitamin B6 metabolism [Kazachstania barnettii]CAD1783827.1 similar to Saccharomyces cerevisiae YNR027W BUD17 Putative pyridoxal kinase, a key enzyme in vitamin B6 metabolism [Kazachstania barnettii]